MTCCFAWCKALDEGEIAEQDIRSETEVQATEIGQLALRVSVTGGNFEGASIGQKKQEINITGSFGYSVQNVANYHYVQGGQDQKRSSDDDDEWIYLPGSIKMSKHKCLSEYSQVYYGERISEVTGTQPLAVKLLRFDDKNALEAKTLTKLARHPNVVVIVHSDVCPQSTQMFIAMEFCQTETLHDLIEKNRSDNVPFNSDLAKSYIEQIFEGVKFIHDNDVVHGDLKPGNILISSDRKYLKISDFGISKELGVGYSATKQTRAGTDGFKAPETLKYGIISKPSDIYPLGVVTHIVLSNGKHPFGDNPHLLNYHIIENKNLDLSQLLVPDAAEAEHLLRWMLHPEPKQRPEANQLLNHSLFKKSDSHSDGDQQTSRTNEGQNTKPEAETDDRSTAEESLAMDVSSTSMEDSNRDEDETKIKEAIGGRNQEMMAVEDTRSGGHQQTWVQSEELEEWIERRLKKDLKFELLPRIEYSNQEEDETNRRKSIERRNLEMMAEEENCQTLMKESKFANALIKLKDLVAKGQNERSTKLMIAECNLQLGKDEKAREVIDDIRQDMMTSPRPKISDVKSQIQHCIKHSLHIRAIILIPFLSKLFVVDSLPFNAVDGIWKCMRDMSQIIEAMAKLGGRLKVIASDFGIPSMFEMLKDFRSLSIDDVDRKKESEARCLIYIGDSYDDVGEYNRAIEIYTEGLRILEHFGTNASKYQIHGHLLHNIGYANHNLGKYEETENYLLRSIEAHEKATNWANDDAKQTSIEHARNNLKNIRDRMNK